MDAINRDSLNPPVEKIQALDVDIVLRHPNAKIPTKAHNIDNGYDLYAVDCNYDEKLDAYVYSTGISIGVPVGYSLDVIPKSRHRKTSTYMPNSPSDIDPGYTGIIYVTYKPRLPKIARRILEGLLNMLGINEVESYNKLNKLRQALLDEVNPPYGAGQAIAQCYLTPHPDINFNVVDELPESDRGEGGHGSSEVNNH